MVDIPRDTDGEMPKDFIPLGFGQYLFTEDSALSFLDPSFKKANLLKMSQVHHVNNISMTPIISQDEIYSPDHLVDDELETTNVPLLDILLPQEGAPPIIQRRQFNHAPPLDVPQAMEPPMALLLPAEDLTQSDALVADQKVLMPNPTRSGIHFYHHPA